MSFEVSAAQNQRADRSSSRLSNPRAIRPLAWTIVGLVCASAIVVVTGFSVISVQQNRLHSAQVIDRELRTFLTALIDAETGVRGYVITGKPEYLEPFQSGSATLEALAPSLLPSIDSYSYSNGSVNTASHSLRMLRSAWLTAVSHAEEKSLSVAQSDLETSHSKALMDSLRRDVGSFLTSHEQSDERDWGYVAAEQGWVTLLDLVGGAIAVAALVFAFDRAIRDAARRLHAVNEHTAVARQVRLLLVMAEMLQSAADRDDANEVLRGSAVQLLPGTRRCSVCLQCIARSPGPFNVVARHL